MSTCYGRRGWLGPLSWGLLGALASAPAWAQEPIEWSVGADVRHRTLSEWSNGEKLLTEKGPVGHLLLGAQVISPAWPAVRMEASLGGGQLDYDGRSQAGTPLATTSRHTDADLAVYWRPLPAAGWGEAWVGVGTVWRRRDIASSSVAGGLMETSSLIMPGVRWRSAAFSGSPSLRLEMQWRASVRHRLAVDYGGVFDNSSLKGGRRSEASLRLILDAESGWQGSLAWVHSRQVASDEVSLYRAGLFAGTVHQPKVRIDDVSVSLTRRF